MHCCAHWRYEAVAAAAARARCMVQLLAICKVLRAYPAVNEGFLCNSSWNSWHVVMEQCHCYSSTVSGDMQCIATNFFQLWCFLLLASSLDMPCNTMAALFAPVGLLRQNLDYSVTKFTVRDIIVFCRVPCTSDTNGLWRGISRANGSSVSAASTFCPYLQERHV